MLSGLTPSNSKPRCWSHFDNHEVPIGRTLKLTTTSISSVGRMNSAPCSMASTSTIWPPTSNHDSESSIARSNNVSHPSLAAGVRYRNWIVTLAPRWCPCAERHPQATERPNTVDENRTKSTCRRVTQLQRQASPVVTVHLRQLHRERS